MNSFNLNVISYYYVIDIFSVIFREMIREEKFDCPATLVQRSKVAPNRGGEGGKLRDEEKEEKEEEEGKQRKVHGQGFDEGIVTHNGSNGGRTISRIFQVSPRNLSCVHGYLTTFENFATYRSQVVIT